MNEQVFRNSNHNCNIVRCSGFPEISSWVTGISIVARYLKGMQNILYIEPFFGYL
jgi:hypothetical protein